VTIAQFRRWLESKIEWAAGAEEFNESEHAESQSLIGQAYELAIELRLPEAAAAARRGPVRQRLVEILNAIAEPADSMLTLAEAAEILGYSEPGLRKIVARTKAGKPGIQFAQIGNGPIKFKREWLDAFTTANMKTPKPRAKPLHW
jgi:hypothetical protein